MTKKPLKLYVCGDCKAAQHRIFQDDFPMECQRCGSDNLIVRPE